MIYERIKYIMKLINKSQPTDVVRVDDSLQTKLYMFAGLKKCYKCNKYNGEEEQFLMNGAPSDIFVSKSVPVEDMIITTVVSEKDEGLQDVDKDTINWLLEGADMEYDTRIKLYPNWREIVDNYIRDYDDDKDVLSEPIGCIVLSQTNNGMSTVSEFALANLDTVRICYAANIGKTEAELMFAQKLNQAMGENGLNGAFTMVLRLWYCIQIALLHPVIKDRFSTKKKSVVEQRKTRSGRKLPPKIKYVKYRQIQDSDFEDAFEESCKEGSNYHRTALVWYVTGHWRNQATKDGHKRIFINGHWKGALRDMKNSETREREMVLSGSNKS